MSPRNAGNQGGTTDAEEVVEVYAVPAEGGEKRGRRWRKIGWMLAGFLTVMLVALAFSLAGYVFWGIGPVAWVFGEPAPTATVAAAEVIPVPVASVVPQEKATIPVAPQEKATEAAAEVTPVPAANTVVPDVPTLASGSTCSDDWPKTSGAFLDRLLTGQPASDGSWMPAELDEVFRPVGEPEAWAIAREEGFVDGHYVSAVPFWASNKWWKSLVQDGWYYDGEQRARDGFEGHPLRAGMKADTSGLVTGVTFRCGGAPMATVKTQAQPAQGSSVTAASTVVPSSTGWTEAFVRQTFGLVDTIKLEACPGEQNCWQVVPGQGFVVVNNPTNCWLTGYCKEPGELMPGEKDPKTGIAPNSTNVEVEAAQFRPCPK